MRLTRIDDCDLNLFEFDYDLTFSVFFFNAEGKVYGRYGGRDATSADSRQSLEGLKYTMLSVLQMHQRETKQFAPRSETKQKYLRDVTGWYGGGCMHCHQIKEAINEKLVRDGEWNHNQVWRYPLPENIGVRLEVDRGNVVELVQPETPASALGIEPGDALLTLGSVPIHSFADAQFALDKAPAEGTLKVTWVHDHKRLSGTLVLPDQWKKSDITWRASMRWRQVPSLPLSGDDLKPDERQALGLSPTQMAFRSERLKPRAQEAGIQAGDVIVAIDDKTLDMTAADFRQHIRHQYLVGDTITLTILREGKRLQIPLTLSN